MPSVSSLLDQAIQENPADAPMSPFDDVLREVCAWMNRTYGTVLHAALQDGSAPRVRYLMIWPKGRRHERSIFVGAYTTEHTAQVLGSDVPKFSETEAFGRYIVDLVKRPSFRDIIEAFKEQAAEPVDGVLRVGMNRMVTLLADLRVKIDASQQRRLADAAESDPPLPRIKDLTVQVTAGTYSPQRAPHWLIAGGYVLQIEHVAEDASGHLRLTGTPVAAAELD
jgi:hypothetical protein